MKSVAQKVYEKYLLKDFIDFIIEEQNNDLVIILKRNPHLLKEILYDTVGTFLEQRNKEMSKWKSLK